MLTPSKTDIFLVPIAMLVVMTASAATSDQDYETAIVLDASYTLDGISLDTEHYRFDPRVRNDGAMNRYSLFSNEQSIDAYGDSLAAERAREQEAIAALLAMKGSEAYTRGLEAATEAPLALTRQVFEDPLAAVQSLPRGLSNLLGDVSNALGDLGKGQDAGDDEMFKSLVGYHRAKRRLAAELGVDPYSSNEALQVQLNDLTWSVFAGGATIDVAIAGGPAGAGLVLSASRSAQQVRGVPWNVPTSTLNKAASEALQAMGLDVQQAEQVVHAKACTLTHRISFVAALAAVDTLRGRDRFALQMIAAQNEDDCRRLRETAELLWLFHTGVRPVVAIEMLGDGVLASDANGHRVFLLRADYLAWTASSHALADSLAQRAVAQLVLTGQLSHSAAEAFVERGITPGERLVGEYTQSLDVARVLVSERLAAGGEAQQNQTGKLVDDVSQGVGNLFNSLGNSLGGATAGEPKQ